MGSGASIETLNQLNIDYATLKSSQIDFASAYSALELKLEKRKNTDAVGDLSIPFLAIRQLSHNLRDQENLERTKTKVLKSRSLPNNLKYKDHLVDICNTERDVGEEFDNVDDLVLVPDVEYGIPGGSVSTKPKNKRPGLSLAIELNDTVDLNSSHSITYSESSEVVVDPQSFYSENTVRIGELKILETGILSDQENSKKINSMSANAKSLPAIRGKDDFVEIATLGSGASGVVCEAIHVPTMTIVALKMLPIYNQEKKLHVARELSILYRNLAELRLVAESFFGSQRNVLSDETQSASTDRCDNILSLYNAFIDPHSGMINLVIEYMDGGSLEDLVRQGGCKDEQVLADISRQSLNGLLYLHSNNYIHRDIKPANILCSSSGKIKIADFGISKALDKSTGFTHSFIGTVCYMSPERINHEDYSFSSDIWSLGLTVLTVAGGKFPLLVHESAEKDKAAPHDGAVGGPKGFWNMIQAICDQDPPIAGPNFSKLFNQFVDSCLQKDPSLRRTSAQLLESTFIIRHSATVGIAASVIKQNVANQLLDSINGTTLGNIQASDANIDDENSIIYAIRMEHLDRILGKMSQKFSSEKKVSFQPVSDAKRTDFVREMESFESEGNENHYQVDSIVSNKVPHVHFDQKVSNVSKRKSENNRIISDLPKKTEPGLENFSSDHNLTNKRAHSFGQPLTNNSISGTGESTSLPRFDRTGLIKWKNLSAQLHLPLPIVLIAVRARLGNLIDLDHCTN